MGSGVGPLFRTAKDSAGARGGGAAAGGGGGRGGGGGGAAGGWEPGQGERGQRERAEVSHGDSHFEGLTAASFRPPPGGRIGTRELPDETVISCLRRR